MQFVETSGVEGMASGGDGLMVCQLLVECQRKVWEREGILGEKLWGVEENGPLLSENGEDPDGEIGTTEVPIEDMGVNKEMEMEEGSIDTQEKGKKDGGVAEKEETNLGKLASSSGWKKRKGTGSDHETNAHLGIEATSVTRTKRNDKVVIDDEPVSTKRKKKKNILRCKRRKTEK